jgi:hypothetical protein
MTRFAAAINCMDGRVQNPVVEYIRRHHGVDYVDMITEPGPDLILAERTDKVACDSIRKRLDVSSQAHGSRLFFIVGHHDCAGNPTDKAAHLRQMEAAVATIRSWISEGVVLGLWVDKSWVVHEVPPRETLAGHQEEGAGAD